MIAEAGSVSAVLALIVEIIAMLVISSAMIIGTIYIQGMQSTAYILMLSGIYLGIYVLLRPIVKKLEGRK